MNNIHTKLENKFENSDFEKESHIIPEKKWTKTFFGKKENVEQKEYLLKLIYDLNRLLVHTHKHCVIYSIANMYGCYCK